MGKLSFVSVLSFLAKMVRVQKSQGQKWDSNLRTYKKQTNTMESQKNISLGSVGDSTLDITVPGNHILDVFEYEHFFLGCFQDGFSASQEGWSLQEMVTE